MSWSLTRVQTSNDTDYDNFVNYIETLIKKLKEVQPEDFIDDVFTISENRDLTRQGWKTTYYEFQLLYGNSDVFLTTDGILTYSTKDSYFEARITEPTAYRKLKEIFRYVRKLYPD